VVRKNRTVGYHPPGSHRRMRRIVGAAGVLIALALLAVSFAAGRGSVSTTRQAPAHTAMPLDRGVPIPDRHSPAGAASAAANFQIAGFQVAAGSLAATPAAQILLAANADGGARAVLADPTASTDEQRRERTSYAPLSLSIKDYTAHRATVLVWGVATISVKAEPVPGGTETWGRVSIRLVWDGSQWRVQSQDYERGPWPVRADVRLAEAEGDFAFRFDELTQYGWIYVPEP
jgi:hypothetical protein